MTVVPDNGPSYADHVSRIIGHCRRSHINN
jgi:hypothetical protein